jgi:hypothetical protein
MARVRWTFAAIQHLALQRIRMYRLPYNVAAPQPMARLNLRFIC